MPCHDDTYGDLAVRFERTEAGWIVFRVESKGKSHTIAASLVFNPFPAFFKWLEDILDGEMLIQWFIDREGTVHRLIYSQIPREVEVVSDGDGILLVLENQEIFSFLILLNFL